MTALWILGILAALLILICLTRVGVLVRMDGTSVQADVRIGLIHFRVYPGNGKEKKPKKPKKPKKEKAEPGKKKSRPSLEELRDAAKTLWPPVKRALQHFGRGIRIDPMRLHVTLGGQDDPAETAKLYGWLHAGIWTVMPLLEQMMDIPDPSIHVGVDFGEEATVPRGEVGISIRIGTTLAVALGAGIPALKWYLRYRKKQKKQPPVTGGEKG